MVAKAKNKKEQELDILSQIQELIESASKIDTNKCVIHDKKIDTLFKYIKKNDGKLDKLISAYEGLKEKTEKTYKAVVLGNGEPSMVTKQALFDKDLNDHLGDHDKSTLGWQWKVGIALIIIGFIVNITLTLYTANKSIKNEKLEIRKYETLVERIIKKTGITP